MVLGRLPLYGELEASPDCSQASSLSAEEIVVVYHERTKHHYQRFAASVGYMDWATQPAGHYYRVRRPRPLFWVGR